MQHHFPAWDVSHGLGAGEGASSPSVSNTGCAHKQLRLGGKMCHMCAHWSRILYLKMLGREGEVNRAHIK